MQKGHVRSEVEKYVDKRVEEVKDEAVTYIINKVLNNMVGNEPLNELKIDKPKEIVQVDDDGLTQNQKVIKALFIGKTLVWDRSNSGQKYEVRVEGVKKFVDNKTGKVIEAKSPSIACRILAGGGSYNGWNCFKVCLDPNEGPKTLSYQRAKFLSAQNKL
ncbi:hypothetical protein [Wolbachia endosymbiont (group B) of Limnophora tigrina]|uniref:hypothetical protein n=1 Tax=Wolbachia endosymbiont (group B) of Limnophora tigrina TaxID=3139317 RepID=UPI0035B50915